MKILALCLICATVPVACGSGPVFPTEAPAGSNSAARVIGWGENAEGQINIPASATSVVAIAVGAYHSLALRSDGIVLAWGANNAGQIDVPAGLSNVISIDAGEYYSLALRQDGTVIGWGAPETGPYPPPTSLSNLISVAVGHSFNIGLLSGGAVAAWGPWPSYVIIGSSDNVAIGKDGLLLKSNGTLFSWNPLENTETQIYPGISDFVLLASGGSFQFPPPMAPNNEQLQLAPVAPSYIRGLVLRHNGEVLALGDNTFGQGSIPETLTDAISLSASTVSSIALRKDGSLVGWGMLTNPAVGLSNLVPPGLSNVVRVAIGTRHSLAIIDTLPPSTTVHIEQSFSDFDRTFFSFSTRTICGRVYLPERMGALFHDAWIPMTLFPGNGLTLSFTNLQLDSSQQFYRVRHF